MGNTNKRNYHGITDILLLFSFDGRVVVGALIGINMFNNPCRHMETPGVGVYSIQLEYSNCWSQSLDVGNQGVELLPGVCEVISRQALSVD